MIIKKKVNMGMGFAQKKAYEYQGVKYEADLKDGDLVKITNGGTTQMGQYGEQHIFGLQTRNGEKALALNQSSLNNLVEAFGEETENWKDKEVKVWIIKAMVSGKMQNVVYLAPKDWEMTDDGNFFPTNSVQVDDEGLDSIDIDAI